MKRDFFFIFCYSNDNKDRKGSDETVISTCVLLVIKFFELGGS